MSQPGFPVSAPSNIEADFAGLTARAVAVINALIASGDFIPAHTPDDTSISFVDNEQVQLGFPAAKIVFNETGGQGETIIGGFNGNETTIAINDNSETITLSRQTSIFQGLAVDGGITSSEYVIAASGYQCAGSQVVANRQAAVADASGGAVIDIEARAALNSLLAKLRTHGLIST